MKKSEFKQLIKECIKEINEDKNENQIDDIKIDAVNRVADVLAKHFDKWIKLGAIQPTNKQYHYQQQKKPFYYTGIDNPVLTNKSLKYFVCNASWASGEFIQNLMKIKGVKYSNYLPIYSLTTVGISTKSSMLDDFSNNKPSTVTFKNFDNTKNVIKVANEDDLKNKCIMFVEKNTKWIESLHKDVIKAAK